MITYIISSHDNKGRKFVLWNTGNYQYQIEIHNKNKTDKIDFEAEYYDAMEIFRNAVKNPNFDRLVDIAKEV